MRRSALAVLAMFGLVVALAACGDDSSGGDDDATEQEGRDETQQKKPADDEAGEQPAGPATVSVADTEIGQVLVDAEGKTLYLYADDQGTTSAVPANILSAWPPLTVESEEVVAGEGVDQPKLGTAPQPDGSIWVTYNGHLLYRFSGDAAAGDTVGHKLGNIWFALTATGEQAA